LNPFTQNNKTADHFATEAGSKTIAMTDSVLIRELVPRDAEALKALRLSCIVSDPFSFSMTVEEERMITNVQLHSLLEHFYFSSNGALWGAFKGRKLIGMIGLEPLQGSVYDHRGVVTGLCVLSEYRGQGAGKALIDHVIAFAKQLPVLEYLILEVSDISTAAIRLYRKAGFIENGREPNALAYGSRRIDLLRMHLPVSCLT